MFALFVIAAALLVSAAPRAGAQPARRWLADPELLTAPKTIGPSGAQLIPDRVTSILLEDGATGWATAAGGIFRLESGFWRRFQAASGTTFYNAVGGDAQSGLWIAGSETERVPPYRSRALLLRYDGAAWQPVDALAGPAGPLMGALSGVSSGPLGVWAFGGQPSDVDTWQRPLLLRYDGQAWHDATPAEWRYGYLTGLVQVGPGEAWATGLLGRPGGDGADAVRPAALHYHDGAWSEVPLPELVSSSQPFSFGGLQMVGRDEGWAVFYDVGAECGFGRLVHYQGGAWSAFAPANQRSITSIALIPGTSRGWVTLGGCQARGQNVPAQRARFDNGAIEVDPAGAQLVPSVYALLDDNNQWAAAGGSFMRYADGPLPTDRVAAGGPGERWFPETGHSIGGEFRQYYETHGLEFGDRGVSARESLALFGYPVSQPFDEVNPENGVHYTVQYFERARFELHPENQPPYRVLLGRLGVTSLGRQHPGEPRIPNPDAAPPAAGCDRFPETGYDLCAPFRDFWRRSGGLPVYGFPVTIARDEQNPTDGRSYQTQWYERERLEHHPEHAGTPYEVLLGLLGAEDLRLRGYLP
jgi:hypothetical protein